VTRVQSCALDLFLDPRILACGVIGMVGACRH